MSLKRDHDRAGSMLLLTVISSGSLYFYLVWKSASFTLSVSTASTLLLIFSAHQRLFFYQGLGYCLFSHL